MQNTQIPSALSSSCTSLLDLRGKRSEFDPPWPHATPRELKALIRDQGWRLSDLAFWLQISRAALYVIIERRDRPVQWTIALLNVPKITPKQLKSLKQDRLRATKKDGDPMPTSMERRLGDEWVATRHIGELADEGQSAWIESIEAEPGGRGFLLQFQSGELDWFPADMLESHFAETGRNRYEEIL